jgi:hypothetical protein
MPEKEGWSRKFDDPIPMPDGRTLVTLMDAGDYIMKQPKAEQNHEVWQTAIACPIGAAEAAISSCMRGSASCGR